ncbi:MAG: hypothetical protein JNL69_00815 [Bacteroidia bacterium]|nr:hypothetical protein [Bacteroidia bacterium]
MYYFKASFTSFKNKFNQNWKDEEIDKNLFDYLFSQKIISKEQIFTDIDIIYSEKTVYPDFAFNSTTKFQPPVKIADGFIVYETYNNLAVAPQKEKVKLEDIQPIVANEYKINFEEKEFIVTPEKFKDNSERLLMYASFLQSAYDALDAIDKISKNLETFDETKAISFYLEYDNIQMLNNQRIDIWQGFVNKKIETIVDEEKTKVLMALNARMQQLKNSEADIIYAYNKAQEEFKKNLSKGLWDEISEALEPISKEIEKVIQNVGKEAEKFGQNLSKNLEKGIHDIGKQLEKDVQNAGMAIEVSVNFIGDQAEAYGKSLSNAEKRIREGKIIDAIWHLYTDPIKYGDENLAKAVQKSSLLNNIASSVCTIYGGPGGAAAYAAWYTYKVTNDLSLALKTGLITGLTSYYTKEINGTEGLVLPKEELFKKALATSAIGAAAIAASGGDEKAILEGFLKGVALSVASNEYKKLTAMEIEGRAPTQDPALKLKLDYTKDKYLILRDSADKNLFKPVESPLGIVYFVPNDGYETLTLTELGRSVSMVGVASVTDNGFQVFTETAIPMKLLAKLPYINDMAYFHDKWCDTVGNLNALETAITILPATILTVGGSPTPLLTQIQEQALENKEKLKNP